MRVKVWTQRIILGAALGFCSLQAGKCAYKKFIPPDPSTQLVSKPKGKQKLIGWYDNLVSDGMHETCLFRATGIQSRFSVRYLSLGDPFPHAEAERKYSQGGALLVRLKFKPRELNGMIKGDDKVIEALENLNGQFEEFGKRIMVTIDLAKIAYSPVLRPAARIVHEKLHAVNINWIGNPAEGDPPALPGSRWTAIDLFQKELIEGKTAGFEEMFRPALEQAKKFNLPIVLTVGSKAEEVVKLRFLTDAVRAAMATDEVGALVIFNASNNENLQLSPASLEKLGGVLQEYRPAFALDITGRPEAPASLDFPSWEERVEIVLPQFTPAYSQLTPYMVNHVRLSTDGFYTQYEPTTCNDIGKRFYTAGDLGDEIRIRKYIYDLEQKLPKAVGDIYEGPLRQDLARAYLALAAYTPIFKYRVGLIDKAYEALNVPFTWTQGKKNSNGIRIEPGYLDMKVQIALILAETEQVGSLVRVEKMCDEIDKILADNRNIVDDLIANYDHTVGGYTSRLNLVRGTIAEQRQDYDSARAFFAAAVDWALKKDQRQTVTVGTLGEARIDLASRDLNKIGRAAELLRPLYDYPELFDATEKIGFMDRGFEVLIEELQRAMFLSGNDPEKAREIFEKAVPWDILNRRPDLLKALDIDEDDLINPELDRAQLIIEGLSLPHIKWRNDMLPTRLADLRHFFNY